MNNYYQHILPFLFCLKRKWSVLVFIIFLSNLPVLANMAVSGAAGEGMALSSTIKQPAFAWQQQFLRNGLLALTQGGGYMVVENADKFPAADQLTFSLIQVPWRRQNTNGTYTPYNQNHDRVNLKISNKGAGPLTINSLTLSNPAAWKITRLNDAIYNATTSFPLTLGPGASAVVSIRFVAKDLGGRVKILHDALTIASNDGVAPNRKILLHGLWQYKGEGTHEPYAQEIINAFGFSTKTGYTRDDGAIDGNGVVPESDEIISAFFVAADPGKPVKVVQVAAYHGCCSDTERFRYYSKGSTTLTTLFIHNPLDGQSLLPRKKDSSTELAQGSFSASGAFGFRVGSANSDRSKNFQGKIGMRMWKAIDANGNIVPNAYFIGSDYLGTEFTNYDYQDNVFYISNIKPEAGTGNYSELAAVPSAVTFGSVRAGASQTLALKLTNLGKTYSDGSKDPAMQISKAEIVGPDKAEFAVPAPPGRRAGCSANSGGKGEF